MKFAFYILPVVSLICGIVLMKMSAMKQNSIFGFRTKASTKNEQTWEYCNRLCAKFLIAIGVISTAVILIFSNTSTLLFGVLELGEMVNIVAILAILVSIPIVQQRCKRRFPDLFAKDES